MNILILYKRIKILTGARDRIISIVRVSDGHCESHVVTRGAREPHGCCVDPSEMGSGSYR